MAAAPDDPTPEGTISVRDLGIRFTRNRGARRSFKDLFGGRTRRRRPDEFWPLRNVSFDVAPGEAIGVVGRNGQGKSTLLKLVAQVMLPDEGTVTVSGGVAPLIEITGGFVNDLTVRDNVNLTAGLHGMTPREIAARFDEIIAFAELEKFVDTPYKHLSSGMRVRLAFAVISRLEEPIILGRRRPVQGEVLHPHRRVARRRAHAVLRVAQREGPPAVLHPRPLPRQGRTGARRAHTRRRRPLQGRLRGQLARVRCGG
jgi:ABC-type ATPase involved in cell division